MKLIVIIIFLIINCLTGLSQDWNVIQDMQDYLYFRDQMDKEALSRTDAYKDIEGSPFLNNNFVTGSIITKDSLMYKDILLRYNIYQDEMEFTITPDDDPRIIGSPRNFLFFNLEDRVFAYISFQLNKKPASGYFELLNMGECKFLIRRHTYFAQAEASRGYIGPTPARFEKGKDAYYLKLGTDLPIEINMNRNSVLEAFGEKQDIIAGFVKDNNLSYRRPEDLVKMVQYYNSLN